ncbi:Petal formation-expressed protein [Dioscorea alata]|uniref:Petal formation-expressed protein n=1 Tax=Dioscorea alata TaxID=55571 RepID=A0ACB7W3J1_DIOAL|nr:Petal formation-expressed protein [Dioscorea alata]
MHSIIGAQRNNWHHLLFYSINSINFSASFMACMANFTAPHHPFLTFLAFKFSSVFLYATVTAFIILVNKIQPSQLAEEQRNATRLFKQLEKSIYSTLELETPSIMDVEMAMERVLALDKAYPLPLLPGMLEKFPKTVKPTIWWPEMMKKKKKEEEEVQGSIIAGMATVGAVFIGWPELRGVPEFMAMVGGVIGVVVNSMQHGWQVGMLFELMRNCAGYYRRLVEEIEFSLDEKRKEDDEEMFKLKIALCLGRSVSEFKDFASYASSSSSCEDDGKIEVFAGKLF